MARRRVYDDDDGRTIADMSGLERPRLIVPRHWDNIHKSNIPPVPEPELEPEQEEKSPRPWEPSADELSPEDRRVYILAAVGSGLLIGGIFILAAVLLILAMLALWA